MDIFGGKLLFILVKNTWSLIACLVIGAMLLQTRCANISHEKDLNVTTWDAFGYYVYLPAIFIYKDYKKLDWLDSIDKKYDVTGGNGWQAIKLENGNYTFKYLGGVALNPAKIAGMAWREVVHRPLNIYIFRSSAHIGDSGMTFHKEGRITRNMDVGCGKALSLSHITTN